MRKIDATQKNIISIILSILYILLVPMCIQNALQQHILEITNDGKTVADFFFATMQGKTPNAKTHHRLEAAKQLRILGLHTPETQDDNPPHPVHPVSSTPVTDIDIINYEVASLIREETSDGYFIADFLARAMRGTDSQGRPVSPADRMAAAKELMNRGLGRFGDTRDRRISSSPEDQDFIHSDLSRYIRDRTENGLDTARFLLDVASGQEQSFSMHQRVVATRELIRRGWDTNYEAVTSEDIAAYHERQEALEPTEYDIRLQEWRADQLAAQEAQPVGATGRSPEDEPQLEAGIFAHLTTAEIARYEAMSAKDRQEFIDQQRQHRASSHSAATHQITHTVRPEPCPELVEGHSEENSRRDGGENHENIDWNTLLQEVSAPPRTPHPTHPVHPVNSQTRIRSP